MVSQPRIELVFFDLIVVSPFDPERGLEMLHKKAGGREEEGGEDSKMAMARRATAVSRRRMRSTVVKKA